MVVREVTEDVQMDKLTAIETYHQGLSSLIGECHTRLCFPQRRVESGPLVQSRGCCFSHLSRLVPTSFPLPPSLFFFFPTGCISVSLLSTAPLLR